VSTVARKPPRNLVPGYRGVAVKLLLFFLARCFRWTETILTQSSLYLYLYTIQWSVRERFIILKAIIKTVVRYKYIILLLFAGSINYNIMIWDTPTTIDADHSFDERSLPPPPPPPPTYLYYSCFYLSLYYSQAVVFAYLYVGCAPRQSVTTFIGTRYPVAIIPPKKPPKFPTTI